MATSTAHTPTSLRVTSSGPAGSGLVLSGDRAADVVAFEGEVVDFFVSAADLLGVPKSVAAIYGIVFASPVPISFAEIEARLDISKGSVSQGLRVLREVGALKEVSTTADKTELYEPDMELRRLIGRFLENRLERQLAAGKARLDGLEEGTGAYSAADQKILRQRVKKLSDWHSKARSVLPIVRGLLKVTG